MTNNKMLKKLLQSFVFFFFFSSNLYAEPPSVEFVDYIDNQYLTIKFNEDIQRISPNNIPIKISPNISCDWVWEDKRNLKCRTGYGTETFKPATKYKIILEEGLYQLNGVKVATFTHNLETQRPQIEEFYAKQWLEPTKPEIQVFFNYSVTQQSLQQSLYLQDSKGKLVELLVKPSEEQNESRENESYNANTSWLLTPNTLLKPNRSYKLVQTSGIKTPIGELKSKKLVLKRVIKTFGSYQYVNRTCNQNWDEERVNTPCDANSAIYLNFSSPLNKKQAKQCLDSVDEIDLDFRDFLKDGKTAKVYVRQASKEIRIPCFTEVEDIFGRKIQDTDITVDSLDFTPARDDLYIEEVLTINDELRLDAKTLNYDELLTTFEYLDFKWLNKTYNTKVNIPKNEFGKTNILPDPTVSLNQVSGFVKYSPESRSRSQSNFSIQKARYNIKIQRSNYETLFFITDLISGAPLTNTRFTISKLNLDFVEDSSPVKLKTNQKGVVVTTDLSIRKLLDWVERRRGNPKLLFEFNDDWESKQVLTSNFRVSPEVSGESDEYDDLHQSEWLWGLTDKPIYRPGETVKFSLYLRNYDDKKLNIPLLKEESLLYVEGDDTNCWSLKDCDSFYKLKNPSFDSFGNLSGEFQLPSSVKDGNFYFAIERDKGRYIESVAYFKVANFKAKQLEVKATVKEEFVTQDSKLTVETNAQYYSGGPLISGSVEIGLTVKPEEITDILDKYHEYSFNINDCDNCSNETTSFFQISELNEKGVTKDIVNAPTSLVRYGSIQAQSTVSSKSIEAATSRIVSVPYWSKPYFIGVKDNKWSVPSNKPYTIEALTITPTGEKINLDNITYFLKKRNAFWMREDSEEPKQPIECLNDVNSKCKFIPNVSGYYDVIASISYPDGSTQESYTSHYFYNNASPSTSDISIKADKDKYSVGEVAKFEITNPFEESTALISIHRNKLIDSKVYTISASLQEIELPISDLMAPGFDITVTLIPNKISKPKSKSDIAYSQVTTLRVQVEPLEQEHWFDIEGVKDVYKPGELIKLNILNHSKSGEFVVALIDESIIEQVDDKEYYDLYNSEVSPDKLTWRQPNHYNLLKQLYSSLDRDSDKDWVEGGYDEENMVVVTGSRIKRTDLGLFESDGVFSAGQLTDSLARPANAPPSRSFKSLGISINDFRTIFKESAFWKSDLHIGRKKSKKINVRLPDNLTRWRLIVVGANKVGEINTKSLSLKTQKDLEVRVNAPIQVRKGDEFETAATVISRSQIPLDLSLIINAVDSNGESISEANESFKAVTAFKDKGLTLETKAEIKGAMKILAASTSDEIKDAVVREILVDDTLEQRTNTYYGVVPEQQQFNLHKPLDIHGNDANLNVSLSSSVGSQLAGTYDYMMNYPHQCWEQKSSRGIVAAIQLSLQDYKKEDRALLSSHVADALNSIEEFQASNGGMSFFKPNNYSVSPYLSAYTYRVQLELKKLGYSINELAFNKLRDYLTSYLKNKEQPLRLELENIIINSLSYDKAPVKGLASYIDKLYAQKSNLSLYGKGLLLNTLSKYDQGKSKYSDLKQILIDSTRETEKKLIFTQEESKNWSYLTYNPKSYCSVIDGLVAGNEKQSLVFKLVNSALEYRRDFKGDFGNTISNGYCVMALKGYMDKYETRSDKSKFLLSLDNHQSTIANNNTSKPIPIQFTEAKLLNVSTKSDGKAYATAEVVYDVDRLSTKPYSNGFSIKRGYFKFNGKSWISSNDLQFSKGDWVKVRLEVNNPVMKRFVAITDYVPGGFNPLDKTLSNNAPASLFDTLEEEYYFSEQQLKPATAKFYAEFLPKGKHIVEYLVEVTHSGTFSALSAKIEEMYDDDVYANTSAVTIKVLAK